MPKDEGMRSDSITDAGSSKMQASIMRSVTGRIISASLRFGYVLLPRRHQIVVSKCIV